MDRAMSLKLRITAALVALASGLAVGSASARELVGGCTPGSHWGTPHQELAPAVLQLVNAHRSTLGLQPLRISSALAASAVWKARHMARYNYFGHDDPAPPVARSALDRIRACGYGGTWAGENIAEGFRTPATVMQAWLNSPEHRAAIENARFNAIGIGVAAGARGAFYWVQDFGSTAAAVRGGVLKARRDIRIVRRNGQIVIRALANDRHPAGTSMWITSLPTLPHHGAAYGGPNRILYRPAANFVGRDSFRYTVADSVGGRSTARIVVRVTRG
jgi:uncharacterized protein YkwD